MGEIDFGSIDVGYEIPKLEVTLDQMMQWMYAGASLDFNPIHVDKEFGEKVGLGGTIAHGLSNMARMGKCITDWVEDPGALKKLKVRFSSPARPGDTVTFWGKVKEKKEEEGGKILVLEVGAFNQEGAQILTNGEAVVEIE
ncbi:MAG: MaoC/PaaZ C-terminal domain-containing protein [Actinomycetota bacterium]|nr:MaoC/PaaZ C-terminal domain-containing protein [Actinomycetota bacterium]